MPRGSAAARPTVVLIAAAEHPALREVLAGLEEQGVPGEVRGLPDPRGSSERRADALAAEAASESSLGVGVGLAADGSVAVTHRTLPVNHPVDSGAGPVSAEDARRLGGVAARVVVGLPLQLGPMSPRPDRGLPGQDH